MRRQGSIWIALASVTIALVPSIAGADVPKLRKGFTPNPIIVTGLSSKVEVDMSSTPYLKCSGYTTKQPIYTFELAEAMTSLRLHINDPTQRVLSGILVFPNGGYMCFDSEENIEVTSWPKGTYKFYPIEMGSEYTFSLEIEDPARSKRDAEAAAAAAPVYELTNEGLNPRFLKAVRGTRALAWDLGLTDCRDGRNTALSPVAVFDVKQPIKNLSIDGDFDFVLQPQGSTNAGCWSPNTAGPLEAGRYIVWERSDRLAGKWSIGDPPKVMEVDDRSRNLSFEPGWTAIEIGELAKPLHLTGKIREPERVSRRLQGCDMDTARDPDVYIVAKELVDDVTFRVLYSGGQQELRVLGPLEKTGDDVRIYCEPYEMNKPKNGKFRLGEVEGTYAIWIGGKDAKPGSEFHLLLTTPKTEIDPFVHYVEPPQGLPIAERLVARYYPFLDRAKEIKPGMRSGPDIPFRLFSEAPDALFVYAAADITDNNGKPGPVQGEPLLLEYWDRKVSTVQTWEGMKFDVQTKLLTAERPAKVAFPAKLRAPAIEKLDDAIMLGGPEDEKAIDAYLELSDKYTTCWADYMEKHDPTWGRDVDLYRIRNGEVENVADEIGARANRKCGGSKLEKTQKSLKKQLDKNRDKRRVGQFKSVKKRFGI